MSDSDFKLTDTQRDHLTAALDRIIPASDRHGLPGAGELGIADFVEELLRANPAQQLGLLPALATFSELIDSCGGVDPAFEQIQEKEPGFVPTLVFHAYSGYYQHPKVMEALGIEPRPPHPQGYEMEPFDPSILDKVRSRGTIYREV